MKKIKIKVPTLSRKAVIEDKRELVKQIKITLDRIKKAIIKSKKDSY